jgi:hypothetical protein
VAPASSAAIASNARSSAGAIRAMNASSSCMRLASSASPGANAHHSDWKRCHGSGDVMRGSG